MLCCTLVYTTYDSSVLAIHFFSVPFLAECFLSVYFLHVHFLAVHFLYVYWSVLTEFCGSDNPLCSSSVSAISIIFSLILLSHFV